jgi:predicted SAM-dependent methyltransferase
MTPRKLHIGGKVRSPGWENLNVLPGPAVDHVGDAIDLSRFADGSFAAVYASHVLEHFDYNGPLLRALQEWRRVLVRGGVLHLSVPDLDVLAQLLLQRHRFGVNERFQIMRMMFGGHVDAHDVHLVGLNAEFLTGYLQAAGFERVERVARHSLFADTSDLVVAGTPISLNVNAINPVTVTAPVPAEAETAAVPA